MKFKEYLEEGRFVKGVDNALVNKVLKFLKPKMILIKADKDAENYDRAEDLRNRTSGIIMREYVEKFIDALEKQGEFSYAPKSGNGGYDKYGTSIWVIKIMNELHQPTTPMTKIKKFEKELTTFVKKNM